MRRSLVCALLSLTMACGATAAYAQQDTTPQGAPPAKHQMMSPDERLQHMTKALDLNNEQQQNVKIILEKQQTDMQALRQDTSLSPAERRAKMQQLHQNADQQISGILTPEQQQKWQQMQESQREHMEQHGGTGARPSTSQGPGMQ